MTKPNLCWAKWAIGKRVWGVSNDCDQRKARFKKRLESTAWPPVKRNTVYMCTFIHMHKHGFLCRHMYTVHRTHGSSGWLIQQHIRSLTVTNSWKTDEHKKAHTLTPNLWGGLGQRRRGSDLAAGLSPSQLLFLFSPFFSPTFCYLLHLYHPPPFGLLFLFYLFFITSYFWALISISARYSALPPSPSWGVIDSPSVHLSWKRRRRQCDVIHLSGDGGSAASLITGPINLTHRGRISAAVRQQTHTACLPAEDFLL